METKVCNKCGRELPLDKFSKGGDKDGLQKTCKDCVSVYMRDYAQRKKQQKMPKEIAEELPAPTVEICTFNLADIEKTIICMAIGTLADRPLKEIARALGVSERTLHRKASDYGLSLAESARATYPTATKAKTLMDYQPRELLEALWKKGYDGHFFTYVKQEMTLSKLFGENK